MMTDQGFKAFLQNRDTMQRFSARYRADAALRDRIASGDYTDLDMVIPPGVEVRVALETPETYYCPMPPDPNTRLGDQALENIAGGSTPLSSVGSVGTLASLPSCLSSAGSAGSLSSVHVEGNTRV